MNIGSLIFYIIFRLGFVDLTIADYAENEFYKTYFFEDRYYTMKMVRKIDACVFRLK